MERVFGLAIGYIFGCISPAYFIGRAKGINIKNEGSGNLGATNVMRVLGKKPALIVLMVDIFKGVVACLISYLLFGEKGAADDNTLIYLLYTGFGVMLGHVLPFYLEFSGGKGVACYFGTMMFIDFRVALCCLGIFIIIVFLTRYISLGSCLAVGMAVIIWFAFYMFGISLIQYEGFLESIIIVALMSGLVIFKHHSNITRLLNGTENKFSFKRS